MASKTIKADIAGGSLKLQESRVVASLLIDGADEEQWRRAIEVDNVLQKRSPGTAKRQASLIRARLETMTVELWRLVAQGSNEVATHALFAAATKHSPLLAEFLDRTVREHFLTFQVSLPRKTWVQFLSDLRDRDERVPEWSESTVNKLGDSVFQILKEIGYISDTKTYRLQPVRISSDVMSYLRDHKENYVLERIQVAL